MLTKKQQKKLNEMARKYAISMGMKHKVSVEQLKAWRDRYLIAMELELQKQGKH